MEIMLKIWILLGVLVPIAISQNTYESDYLNQETYHDPGEKSHHASRSSRQQHLRSYEPSSHEEEPSSDPKHYQSLEPSYHKHEPESYVRVPRYHAAPQQVQYHQPEDPSYHRPQEIAYHQATRHYQPDDPSHHRPQEIVYHRPTQHQQTEDQAYHRPQDIVYHRQTQHQQTEDESYHKPQEIAYQQPPQHYQETAPQHQGSYEESTHHLQPEDKSDPKYTAEEPKYVQQPRPSSHSKHPAPVPTDPKLPLYFTMYEKRVIQDPVNKYGKGPWRYLTYGHGITYGSKEPGKVFEKGYGYIRALGRDHCKLPEHLCPPRDEKPFDYEGRKEPYFGYRPH